MHRLRPRAIARAINHKRTLPQRMARELRWAWRDLRDLQAEIKRFAASAATLTPQPPPRPIQSEMTDKDVAHRGY